MLVSIASAEQTMIDSITTNPERPIYVNKGGGGVQNLDTDFTVTVHVINPPAGGCLVYRIGCNNNQAVSIDNNGMATFEVYLQIVYMMGDEIHRCPSYLTLYVYDDQGNVVASAEKLINIQSIPHLTPSITWNNPDDITDITPLSSTQLNAVAIDPVTGNNVPGNFVYTPAEGTVLSEGIHTLRVDFTPTDNTNYNTASKDITIYVWGSPTQETSIPEFPSIALPVVTILGMIAIIGHRKE